MLLQLSILNEECQDRQQSQGQDRTALRDKRGTSTLQSKSDALFSGKARHILISRIHKRSIYSDGKVGEVRQLGDTFSDRSIPPLHATRCMLGHAQKTHARTSGSSARRRLQTAWRLRGRLLSVDSEGRNRRGPPGAAARLAADAPGGSN